MRRDVIEPKVGEVFEYVGIKAKCIVDRKMPKNPCSRCCFSTSGWCHKIECNGYNRADGVDVHFKKVENDEKTN